MKKIKIFLLTFLIFIIPFSVFADPEFGTFEWFLYRRNSAIKSANDPRATETTPSGFIRYCGGLWDIYFGEIPHIEFDADTGYYVLTGNTFLSSGSGPLRDIKAEPIRLCDSSKSDSYAKTMEEALKYYNDIQVYDGTTIKPYTPNSGTVPNPGGSPPSGGETGEPGGAGFINKVGDFFNRLFGYFNTLLSTIADTAKKIVTSLLEGLKDLFKELFLPSDNYFNDKFTALKQKTLSKFGIDNVSSSINALSVPSSPFSDFYMKGTKVLDMSFLNSSIPTIKKYTDGFFWFLLILYNINSIHFILRGVSIFNYITRNR